MSPRMIWVYVAGLLTIPFWPCVMAILRGLALVIAAFFGAISGAFTTTNTAPAPTNATQQQAAATPATDPRLLEVLAQNSNAITKMAENQQETTKALQQNTAVLQQFVVQQQGRQMTPPASATPCSGCGRGEYLEIPHSR